MIISNELQRRDGRPFKDKRGGGSGGYSYSSNGREGLGSSSSSSNADRKRPERPGFGYSRRDIEREAAQAAASRSSRRSRSSSSSSDSSRSRSRSDHVTAWNLKGTWLEDKLKFRLVRFIMPDIRVMHDVHFDCLQCYHEKMKWLRQVKKQIQIW